jgi:hypothetical protein
MPRFLRKLHRLPRNPDRLEAVCAELADKAKFDDAALRAISAVEDDVAVPYLQMAEPKVDAIYGLGRIECWRRRGIGKFAPRFLRALG